MSVFESHLWEDNTQLQLLETIIDRLHSWRNDLPLTKVTGPKLLRKAISEQDAIGWENFLFGRVTSTMAEYQQVHYRHINSDKAGTTWLSRLINQGWLIMWQMWQHRNNFNKQETTAQDRTTLHNLSRLVRQEFNLGRNGLTPTDYHLVEDIHTVLDYDLHQMQTWYNRILNARAHFKRVNLRTLNRVRRSAAFMKAYFKPKTRVPKTRVPPRRALSL